MVRSLLTVLLFVGVLVAGCTPTPEEQDRTPAPSQSADDALRFGGIVLPASAKVLGTSYERGIDQLYRLVLSTPSSDVSALLSASRFTAPLVPDPGPYTWKPMDGFDLSKATDVVAADDSLPPEGDRKQTVNRQVFVDRTDPANSIVHLWLFTT